MEPSKKVRLAVYERDEHRCAACGVYSPLSFQHRRAVGMGGSPTPPLPADGLTLCMVCNADCEAGRQKDALYNGWKVPRWVDDPSRVPVWYFARGWFRLEGDDRKRIGFDEARRMFADVYGPRKEDQHGRA